MTALPVFESVGRHLSVARAAEELHLTPGAVSRQIRNLETHLGLALFERAHRRIAFTPTGQDYWSKLHGALGEIREASRIASAQAETEPLIIASPRMFLQKRVLPSLASLYARFPDMVVKFAVDPQDMEQIDGAIAVSPQPRRGFIVDRLDDAYLSPVCSQSYMRDAPPLVTPDDLRHHVLLRSAEYMRNWERWLGRRAAGIFAEARCIDFQSSGLELAGATEGLGIAIVRLSLVREEIASGQLVALFENEAVRDEYAFIFPELKLHSTSFKLFRTWLKYATKPN